jgi:hypothetical protein
VTLVAVLVAAASVARQPAPRETAVGMTGRIEQLVLPGTELEPVPNEDRKPPVVLRLVRTYPHGSAFRYDLDYYGLEAGDYDLKNYLRRKDGSPTADLPALPIKVTPVLPPGQVLPNELEIRSVPFLGGYRVLSVVAGVAWFLGLAAIIYLGFLRRRAGPAGAHAEKPLSLADRLRPLIDGAIAGELTQAQLAGLERTLIAFWRKRLGLENADPAEAMDTLRRHEAAGPLLEQLETWLHRPGPPAAVDPAALLKPYQHLPADALEPIP